MNQRTNWTDHEIRDLKGRKFYLRVKHKGMLVELKIRDRQGGRGNKLAQLTFSILDDNSMSWALDKLCKRWRKFYFVKLTPAWKEK